jgi:hypothetical protein
MVPWQLGHPPFRHCDTSSCTIPHCNDSTQKCFNIVTLQPHRGQSVRPPPNHSIRPLQSGSKRWLWQSDQWDSTTEILANICSAWGRQDSAKYHTQMMLIKTALCNPRELHQHMGQPGMCPNLTKSIMLWGTPNRTPPKHGSMVYCWVGSTMSWVRLG